jgi:hypothetical protein
VSVSSPKDHFVDVDVPDAANPGPAASDKPIQAAMAK